MKAWTLMYPTIAMGVILLQNTANSGKTVSNKKMQKWSDNSNTLNNEGIKLGVVNMKDNSELSSQGDEMDSLIDVIQYVVNNSFNNDEFRTFMIKRFLHNYVPQVSEYLDTIKNLKRKIDPKSTDEDEKKNKAMIDF